MNTKTSDGKIRIEVSLPVPRQQAWTLLTGKTHLANWWGDHITLEAKPGGTFLEKWFDGEREVITSGKIIRFNPPSELKMTWADEDWPGKTLVSLYLSENKNNTRLMLEHSGWETHSTGKRESLVNAHAEGWSRYMKQLSSYAIEKH